MTTIPSTGEPEAGDLQTAVITVAGAIRSSDQERELVIVRLHAAVGEGRLSLDEAEERITAVYGMRYREDLAAVVDDLPADGEPGAATADTPHRGRRSGKEPSGTVCGPCMVIRSRDPPRSSHARPRSPWPPAALLFVAFVILGAGLVA